MKPFASDQYRKRTSFGGVNEPCCLCGRETAGLDGSIHVPINHETSEFVTDEQAAAMGDAVSYFPIGPECAKRWSKEFAATSVRFRRISQGVVSYDERKRR